MCNIMKFAPYNLSSVLVSETVTVPPPQLRDVVKFVKCRIKINYSFIGIYFICIYSSLYVSLSAVASTFGLPITT